MKVWRHLRVSFLAVMALCFVVALSSCSKKEVVQDEPGFSTSEDSGGTFGEMGDDMGSADTMDSGMGMAGDSAGTPIGQSELQTIYFPYDSYSLSTEARETLKTNAQWLKDNPAATIQIEGHCDERGTIEYNIALGERRANATMGYMERLGVEPSRMSVISYGEERPAELGSSESAWSRNRRSEFVILSQ